ncbi:ATP-binding protein [Evansella sp. AB-rgal1]|uniref:ATP-binding protein n=1 Tax=Evansella sp. AB-rgal1 TaxID=3242696 RepID=UPI00359D2C34
MNVHQYVKERWVTFTYLLLAFLFAFTIYKLDKSLHLSDSNATYILTGWGLLTFFYIIIDYFVIKSRFEKINRFAQLKGSTEELEEFPFPLDRNFAEHLQQIVFDFEKYKGEIRTKASAEIDFITKWLHDVKVPISAAKLTLETEEDQLPPKVYKRLYTELFSIEESAQRVFYELKTNRFSDDYKISYISSKKLISTALKSYSSFFSYKKINISITGEECLVLTDEKWSSYILSQIISNAVKYTPKNGYIEITTKTDETKTIVSIKNSGVGISDKDIGQVFKKGYTSSQNRTGLKATGYGLYIAKKLSDQLGHELTVQSTLHEYVQFSLIFQENETIYNVTKM